MTIQVKGVFAPYTYEVHSTWECSSTLYTSLNYMLKKSFKLPRTQITHIVILPRSLVVGLDAILASSCELAFIYSILLMD